MRLHFDREIAGLQRDSSNEQRSGKRDHLRMEGRCLPGNYEALRSVEENPVVMRKSPMPLPPIVW
jgi:hypothetical protein